MGIRNKMASDVRDSMIGNPKLDEMGYGEEALGRNALVAGFQGQRQWTDYFNGDFMESILISSFDWNGIRQPLIMATENDTLNALHDVRPPADQYSPGLR